MKRIFLILTVLAACMTLASCRRAAEKARERIRFVGIERVERQGLTGAEVVVRVENGTGYRLLLDQATLEVYYGDRKAATVFLREGVEVERRSTVSVATKWQVRISDPLALYALVRKLQQDDPSAAAISFSAEGRGGPAPVKFTRERMPLSEFLDIFGLRFEDLKNFLQV